MSKRLKSALIASSVTFVWFILMCVDLVFLSRIEYDSTYYDTLPGILLLLMGVITKLLCICSVPTLFIAVYERLHKEDESWFKYIVAAISVAVFITF